MQVADSLANLCQFRLGLRFLQFLVRLDHLVQRPLLHVLHHDVEIGRIMEKPVELDHVRMREEEADLQLLDELVQHEPHRLLLDLLDGQDEARLPVPGREDLAEPSLPLAGAQLEIFEGDPSWRCWV